MYWCEEIFSTIFPLLVISSNFLVELFERVLIFFSFLSISQHRRKSFSFSFFRSFWSVESARLELRKLESLIWIDCHCSPYNTFYLITPRIPSRWAFDERSSSPLNHHLGVHRFFPLFVPTLCFVSILITRERKGNIEGEDVNGKESKNTQAKWSRVAAVISNA